MPVVMTTEQIYTFLESVYNPVTERHPLDLAQTKEEKQARITEVWGEPRIRELTDLIMDESANQLKKGEFNQYFLDKIKYESAHGTITQLTRENILLKAFNLTRLMGRKHEIPYEQVPILAQDIMARAIPSIVGEEIKNLVLPSHKYL